MNDSLEISENKDGTLKVSWHKDDDRYSFMNGLTPAQVTAIIEQLLMERSITDDQSLLDSDE
jgi:hypothetical protein